MAQEVQTGLTAIGKTIEALIKNEANKPVTVDELTEFYDLSEKELLAAAKQIEEAAKALLAAKAKPKPVDSSPEQIKVTDAILDCAMAITNATGNLIKQATISQRERAEKGRLSANKEFYKKDRAFAEGLISAARAVAFATARMVECANLAAQGQIEEEALIAASKAVAAATAQLVSAARVTSDAFSNTQKALEAASKAVIEATRLLVEAAKTPFPQAEKVYVLPKNPMGRKIAEHEINTNILKLEKDLEQERQKLFKIRKAEYENNQP